MENKLELPIGNYFNISDKEYHSLDYISSHGLMRVLKSPAHYLYYKNNKIEQSKSMIIGTIMHDLFSAIITGNKVKTIQNVLDNVCVADKRTKEGKLLAETKIVISQDDMNNITGMSEMMINNASILELISGIEYSEAAAVVDLIGLSKSYEGVFAKFKPDAIHTQCIIEYKTTDDASLIEFSKTSCNYLYDLQASFYMMCDALVTGKYRPCHLYIVQENKPPYEIAFYESSPNYLDDGNSLVIKSLDKYVKAKNTSVYDGYGLAPRLLNNPGWAASRGN